MTGAFLCYYGDTRPGVEQNIEIRVSTGLKFTPEKTTLRPAALAGNRTRDLSIQTPRPVIPLLPSNSARLGYAMIGALLGPPRICLPKSCDRFLLTLPDLDTI